MSAPPAQTPEAGAGGGTNNPTTMADRSNSVSNWNRVVKPSSDQPGSSQTLRSRPRGEHAPSLPPKPRSATAASVPPNQGANAAAQYSPPLQAGGRPIAADSSLSSSSSSNQIRVADGSRADVAVQMLQSDIKASAELQNIFNVLAANNFTERDIWEGNPSVYPVLEKMRDAIQVCQPTQATASTIALHFEADEFTKQGVATKLYKLERDKPIAQLISLICKKFGVPNFRRYSFVTMAGYTLDDNEVLSAYGFGTMMKYWELRLVRKTPEQYAKATSASREDSYMVTFLLPQLPQFVGLSQKIQKVKASMPTGDIINHLCRRYKVEHPEQFTLTSMDDFVFSRSEGLEYYGLGKKFDRMVVKLATLEQLKKHNRISMRLANPEFAWTQVDDQLDVREARAVILDMDKQLGFAHENTVKLRAELEQVKAELKKTARSRDQMSDERDHIVAQAKKMIEMYIETKTRLEGLVVERANNQTEIASLQQQLDRLKQSFSQERLALEQKIKALTLELLAERGRAASFRKDYETSQERVAELESTQARIKDGLVRAATELKELRRREAELNAEIEKLNEDIARRMVQENQLSRDIFDLKAEKEQLQNTLDTTYSERDDLARQLSELKAELEQTKKSSEKEKLALRSELETLELKMADEAAQARLALAEVKHELEETQAKVEESGRKLALSEQQKKQLESLLDSERASWTESIEKVKTAFAAKRAEWEQKLEQQTNTAASADSAMKELTDEVSRVRKEREELSAQLSAKEGEFQKARADLEAKLRQVESDLANRDLLASVSISTGSGSDSEAQKRLKEHAIQLQREVDVLRLQSKQAADRTALVDKELELTNQRVKELTESNDKFRSEFSKTKQELDRISNSTGALHTQLEQTRQNLEKEQKAAIEQQQRAHALEKKVTNLESTVQGLRDNLDESTKEKETLSTQLHAALEFKQRFATLQTEKQALEEQWAEQQKSYEERIDKLKQEVEVLSTPPTPPPAMPSQSKASTPMSLTGSGGASLETQLQSMKDALAKVDIATKRKDAGQMNAMSQMIMSGLEKRFKLANHDEAEVLDAGPEALSDVADDDWFE